MAAVEPDKRWKALMLGVTLTAPGGKTSGGDAAAF
jgi:hypothetical protein